VRAIASHLGGHVLRQLPVQPVYVHEYLSVHWRACDAGTGGQGGGVMGITVSGVIEKLRMRIRRRAVAEFLTKSSMITRPLPARTGHSYSRDVDDDQR
jgi:hypothetical protein